MILNLPEPIPPIARRKRRGTSRSTVVDVARLAQVAQSTVSLFFREPSRVSKDTAMRIRAASDELGYLPNPAAMSLATSRSRVVGVVLPSLVSTFFASTLETLQQDLAHEGYQVIVGHTDYDDAVEEQLVRTALSWSPAAIVLTGLHHSRTTRALLANAGTPVIEMWELGGRPTDTLVGFSHAAIGEAMFNHLHERGARSVAFLSARLAVDRRAAARARAFAEAGERVGCRVLLVDEPDHAPAPDVGGHLFAKALAAQPHLDAVGCSNDLMALGMMFEAQRRGLKVPDRIKLIGFGNLNFAASTVPPLSTIAPPGREIGALVARLVIARLRGDRDTCRVHDLGFELIARGTS